MHGPGSDALGGLGGGMSHLSKVMKRCCTVTSSPSLSLSVPQRQYMEHILLPSETLQSAESEQALKPVGMEDTGGGSPDFKRGDGNTMPSLLASDLWQI